MFTNKASTKLRWLLIIGLALLLLMTFLSCSQDAIVNPRNQSEDEDSADAGDDTPDEGGGISLLQIRKGEKLVFLS